MDVSKPRKPSPRSTRNRVEILELYQQCLAKQQNWMKLDLGKLKLIFAKEFLFGRPLFSPLSVADKVSVINRRIDLEIRNQLWEAGKYRDILQALRAQTKQEGRLFVLAWWLSQEKVCEPEDIIGSEMLRQLAKKLFGCLSTKDFQHADAVRAWIPYFDNLIRDFRAVKDSSKLVKQGYDEKAVWVALNKRSPISAACDWLAPRLGVDSPALANAYSRIYGRKYKAFIKRFPSACS
jgi:hypothetical protein